MLYCGIRKDWGVVRALQAGKKRLDAWVPGSWNEPAAHFGGGVNVRKT